MTARLIRVMLMAGVLLASCAPGEESARGSDAGQPPPGDAFQVFFDAAIDDIDGFWAENFASLATTAAYAAPMRVTPYAPGTLPAGAGCGLSTDDPNRWINNAFHCSDDHLIAYDSQFVRDLYAQQGPIAPIAIMAHEWGHHVQSVAGAPSIVMQKELQADCYSGVYVADADERGLFGSTSIRDAVVTFFNQGDSDYSEETWFDTDVHGPPHERALATGSGLLTGDPAYCENYGAYVPRDPLALGSYSLYVPAALNATTDASQLTTIGGPYATAYVAYRTGLAGADASSLLPTFAPGWFGSGTWTPLEEPHSGGVADVLGGSDALQAYEWATTDATGAPVMQHGVLLLLISGSGDGIVIDVARPGPAPELTAENLQGIGDFLYLLAWGICPPSGQAWACEPTQ